MATGSLAKNQHNSTFLAKYDHFFKLIIQQPLDKMPKNCSENTFRSYVLTYNSASP